MISVQRNPILFYQYIPLNSENFKENLRPGYCTACVHQDKVHEFVVAAVKGQAEVSGPRRLRRTAGYKRIVFVFFKSRFNSRRASCLLAFDGFCVSPCLTISEGLKISRGRIWSVTVLSYISSVT